MKTFFVVSERNVNSHAGEYYDFIIEVPHQPILTSEVDVGRPLTPEEKNDDIRNHSQVIRSGLRKAWSKDVADTERSGEPEIHVYLDAASPFNSMLIDFKEIMGKEDGISLNLVYLDNAIISGITASGKRITSDLESIELIEKLEKWTDG